MVDLPTTNNDVPKQTASLLDDTSPGHSQDIFYTA